MTTTSSDWTPSILLLTTTHRGAAVLREIRHLAPNARLAVITTRPRANEPDYQPALGMAAAAYGADWGVVGETTVTPVEEVIANAHIVICSNWRSRIADFGAAGHNGHAFVIHDSLLPKYRGFSPLHWAIRQGDSVTGATMFRPTDEIDAGPIVAQETVMIGENDTIATMLLKMTEAYRSLIRQVLPLVLRGHPVEARPQEGKVSYAPRVDWERDPEIDLTWPDGKIRNHVRAFQTPYPQAFVTIGGQKLKVTL